MEESGVRRQWKEEWKRGEKLDRGDGGGSMHVIGKGSHVYMLSALRGEGRGYTQYLTKGRQVGWIWY